jgi:hypothetical protein
VGDPFLLLPEFELSVTTTGATSHVKAGSPSPQAVPGAEPLAIGPMHLDAVTSTLGVRVTGTNGHDHAASLHPVATTGAFPKGIWGPQPHDKPVPTGETLTAGTGLHLQAQAAISAGTVAIDAHQVEISKRHPLPFLAESEKRGERAFDVTAAAAVTAGAPGDVAGVLAQARAWMTSGLLGAPLTPLAAATFRSGRAAPPQLAPLTLGMVSDPPPAPAVPAAVPPQKRPPVDTRVHPPRVEALMSAVPARSVRAQTRTTVGEAGTGLPRFAPITAAAEVDPRVATRLLRRAPAATLVGDTLVPATAPYSGRAGSGVEARRRLGTHPETLARMEKLTDALGDGVDLIAGEALVLDLPNAARDDRPARPGIAAEGGLPLRVMAAGSAGTVLLDAIAGEGVVELPLRTARVGLIAGPADDGVPGWQAATPLLQFGARAFAGPGCTVEVRERPVRRAGREVSSSFVPAADVVGGFAIVTTRFASGVQAVAVALEAVDERADDVARGLDLGLEGARRTDGEAHMVILGAAAVAVYDVAATGEDPVAVTVAGGEDVHITGVLAARCTAAELAEQLQARGVDGLLAGLVADDGGTVRARWIGQDDNDDDHGDTAS